MKDGRELSVYIIEKNDTEIKYRNANSTGHTIFSTKLTNLKTIQYENGDVDLLSSMNPRSLFPLGISAGISLAAFENDGGMFTCGIDYLFTPNLGAEINIGSGGEDIYYSVGGGNTGLLANIVKVDFRP
ncbi:MAG: hypothetical protein Q7J05_02520 [Paludibacter sp.]|nr:hypothetical protein [Paludibacter sp.]